MSRIEAEIIVLDNEQVAVDFDELAAIIVAMKSCVQYGITRMTWSRMQLTANVILRTGPRKKYVGRPDLDRLGELSEDDFVHEAATAMRNAAKAAKAEYRRSR